MIDVLDCDIIESEFEFQSSYYVHFQIDALEKGIKPPYPQSYWINSTTTIFLYLVSNNQKKVNTL